MGHITKRQRERPAARRFCASMDWWDPAEQPANLADLPPAFASAAELWMQAPERHLPRVLKLLTPYVGARFRVGLLRQWRAILDDASYDESSAIDAAGIALTGISFGRGPLPTCRSEADFELVVSRDFEALDLDAWQQQNGYLSDAIEFYWTLPPSAATDDLDLAWSYSEGVECFPLSLKC